MNSPAIPLNVNGRIYRITRTAYDELIQLAQATNGDRAAVGAALRRAADAGHITMTNIFIGQPPTDEPTE